MPNEQPDQFSIDDSRPRVRLAVPAMTRVLALLVALIPTVMLTLAEDQSRQNKSEQPDSFGVEPSVLKQTSQMLRVGLETPSALIVQLPTPRATRLPGWKKNWRKQKETLGRPLSALSSQAREGNHFLNSHSFFGRNGSNKTIGRGKR